MTEAMKSKIKAKKARAKAKETKKMQLNESNATKKEQRIKEKLKAIQSREPKPTLIELRKMDKPNCLSVKRELFISCGKICMYSMEKFPSSKLVLHHDPPFRDHPVTEFKNSFILSIEAHIYLTELEIRNPEKYQSEMEKIRENKMLLLSRRNKK